MIDFRFVSATILIEFCLHQISLQSIQIQHVLSNVDYYLQPLCRTDKLTQIHLYKNCDKDLYA